MNPTSRPLYDTPLAHNPDNLFFRVARELSSAPGNTGQGRPRGCYGAQLASDSAYDSAYGISGG